MNSFTILPYQHQQVLDCYKYWLVNDLYQNISINSIDDPTFLQKLSLLQADGIRHDISVHSAITHSSVQFASSQVGQIIQSAASFIASSLDDGFILMNSRMLEANNHLKNIDRGVGLIRATVDAVNQNMVAGFKALNDNISQVASIVQYQLKQIEGVLHQILVELQIPESQRERRYHIEEGIKYFNKGMRSGDCLYFDDALDEFMAAISIEKKDYFSWYYTGMIYLYSKDHVNPDKAIKAFDCYIHYADALLQKHYLFDEAWLMKAECKYLLHDFDSAYALVENLIPCNNKAALRGMKYLSATDDKDKQQMAVGILKQLVGNNPYIVMQILEDYNLMTNDYIIDYLKKNRKDMICSISALLASLDKDMGQVNRDASSYLNIKDYQEAVNDYSTLKARVTAPISEISYIDAVTLQEELKRTTLNSSITKAMQIISSRKSIEQAEKNRQAVIQKQRRSLVAQGFVDLGLPSGTVWRNTNEEGEFRLHDAIIRLGRKDDYIPEAWQWEELINHCHWSWNSSLFRSSGYSIIGPNGSSIFLPCSYSIINFSRYYLSSYLSSTIYKNYGDGDRLTVLSISNYRKGLGRSSLDGVHFLRLAF